MIKYGVFDSIEHKWLFKGESEQEAIDFKNNYLADKPSLSRWVEAKVYDPDKVVSRCVHCDRGVTEKEYEEGTITCCPNCGNKGNPVSPDDDVSVNINWGELRILGIWAENWARKTDQLNPSGYSGIRTVHSICRRLQRQFPDKTPLTLAGEIREIQEMGLTVETSFDARENLPD